MSSDAMSFSVASFVIQTPGNLHMTDEVVLAKEKEKKTVLKTHLNLQCVAPSGVFRGATASL